MNSENNNNANNDENKILLPPKTTNKKTLVLDLDETLVHSQFMTFSAPSDVIIKIEIENEVHDIHVMVRPGVKEFLEKMDKFFEIVIFTASVSKYADPLLDIIDKQGYCPFRLFREHCSLINTTFVKDLQRLGRDLKDIVIVDNSPLSYALHPENGLPILTWFEDKNDTELYQIMPVLEFLSYVPDVRDYVPKLVGNNNKIDYEKAKEIINGYNGPRYISQDIESQNTKNNNDLEINVEIIPENEKNNAVLRNAKNNNDEKRIILNDNKKTQDKLSNLDMNNIIASVSRDSVKQNNNQIMINKNNSNNKIYNKKKPDNKTQDKNINKESKNINIELQNFINVKKLSNTNSHSVKKNFKPSITDKSFKTFKNKRISNSAGGNRLKNSLNNNPNTNSKSIILNSNNSSNKFKNQTPKITKSINLLNNKNIHSTRSVKYPKKTKIYINNTTSYDNNNNKSNNKISKSLTKNAFNTEKISNKENIINNKNKKNNTLYKNFTSNNSNLSSQHSKQKIDNNLKSFKDNKKNSNEKGKKFNKKNESKKIKNNNFLKTGSIQQKMNNLSNSNNINMTSSLSLSNKYNNLNKLNINGIDYVRSNRENNQIKLTHFDNNFTNENKNKNYSINNRYEKASNAISNNNNNQNHVENKSLNLKKKTSNNIGILDKDNNKSQKKNFNNIYKSEAISVVNGVKSTRPKSSSNTKFMVKTNISKEKSKNLKNPTKKLEINEILQRRGLAEKNDNIKKEFKK